MNKQTAVQWLEQAYWDNKGTLSQKHFEQAKQMEKEQIERAYVRGDVDSFGGIHHSEYYGNKSAEQYYNETYGGQEE
jgi:hypothetical protein